MIEMKNGHRPTKPSYPHRSVIIWLDCSHELLNLNLERRVDRMIENGLVNELDHFLDSLVDDLNWENDGNLKQVLFYILF